MQKKGCSENGLCVTQAFRDTYIDNIATNEDVGQMTVGQKVAH